MMANRFRAKSFLKTRRRSRLSVPTKAAPSHLRKKIKRAEIKSITRDEAGSSPASVKEKPANKPGSPVTHDKKTVKKDAAQQANRQGKLKIPVGEIRQFTGYKGHMTCVCFSPDGRQVLACGGSKDHDLYLWEVATGKLIRRFAGHTERVLTACFSSDGKKILSGGQDFTAIIWEVNTGKELKCFEGHTARIQSVDLSHNGKWVLTGSGSDDGTIRLWKVATGKEKRSFKKSRPLPQSRVFSPLCGIRAG